MLSKSFPGEFWQSVLNNSLDREILISGPIQHMQHVIEHDTALLREVQIFWTELAFHIPPLGDDQILCITVEVLQWLQVCPIFLSPMGPFKLVPNDLLLLVFRSSMAHQQKWYCFGNLMSTNLIWLNLMGCTEGLWLNQNVTQVSPPSRKAKCPVVKNSSGTFTWLTQFWHKLCESWYWWARQLKSTNHPF